MEKNSVINENIGFIGGGNMASAICEGIIKKGLITYDRVYVSGPRLESLEKWRSKGAKISQENGDVIRNADVIFLCIKPQIFIEFAQSLKKTFPDSFDGEKLIISVLAGTKLETIENELAFLSNTRFIRVMPNTPMTIGEGCCAYSTGRTANENDAKLIELILNASGVCTRVPEALINPIGALAGSGPAFVYLMIEALADGGVRVGLPREMAAKFAAQATLGAAKMVLNTGRHTGTLRDEVCSPGGTTIAGVHALEKGGVRGAIMDAIEAASKRSAELMQKN